MARMSVLRRTSPDFAILLAATVLVSALAAAGASTAHELAARGTGMMPEELDAGPRKSSSDILKVQKALSGLGLYLGPIHGYLNAKTKAAILLYQRSVDLKVDGKISKELWELIDNAANVRLLLQRLDQVRRDKKDAARAALLSHPTTRDLVSNDDSERADPTRDPRHCFERPTARCLLNEASESAKAVFKAELRDWAFGEVLVSQARAGLGKEAMDTARRIRDPRLVMVALRDIAEAQAAAGRAAEALHAAQIIPDKLKKAEALAAIADIQVANNEVFRARDTVARLLNTVSTLNDGLKRISFKTRAAVILAGAGDTDTAAAQLAEAETEARTRESKVERGMALRYVATALADMEQPDQALSVLSDVAQPSERTPVLMTTATALARAGDAAAALSTADTIEAVRYRALVLGRIALAQFEMGEHGAAETTLEMALAAVEQIELPYARSYAISRVAHAMIRFGRLANGGADGGAARSGLATFARAVEIAGRIDDNRLRAHTLWTIAAEQRRAGDAIGAVTTETVADVATVEITSKLSRVWMFCEVAIEYAAAGEAEAGWTAFRKGLQVTSNIDNSWGRARALAKLASTIIELVDSTKSASSRP